MLRFINPQLSLFLCSGRGNVPKDIRKVSCLEEHEINRKSSHKKRGIKNEASSPHLFGQKEMSDSS